MIGEENTKMGKQRMKMGEERMIGEENTKMEKQRMKMGEFRMEI